MENKTLVELVKAKNDLELKIIAAGGELTEILSAIDDDLSTALEVKAGNYCFYLDSLEQAAASWKQDGNKRLEISKGINKVIDKIRDRLKEGLLMLGKDSIESDDYKVTISNTKARLVIEDETLIPSKYKTPVTTYELNKEEIKKALESGELVSGAHLEGGTALRYNLNRGKK